MFDDDLSLILESFSGTARLFPLPNLVMFPHVLQPLHVFEPRYRALLEESLADDKLIAMAVLAPGWEKHYEESPPLHPVACLGRVVTHQPAGDGKYNLLLAGLKRVRIERELPSGKPFRTAEVAVLDDVYSPSAAERRPALQRALLEEFRKLLPNMPDVHKQLGELLCREMSLGVLTDLASYALRMSIDDKVSLLNELDVDRRCRELLQHLGRERPQLTTAAGNGLKWPPDFSAN